MSSQAVAKAAGGLVSITKKHTVQSTGLWEGIRKVFAIDADRSNGVPLNPYYRNPAPGSNDPLAYDDPVTVPAGDIADNPYWKRDHRRHYPATSTVGQVELASLLTVGSAAQPKVELIGEAGEQALVAAKQESEVGLAKTFEKLPQNAAKDLFVAGLPPTPSGTALASGEWDVYKYGVSDRSYPEGYPCRSFK